MDGGGEGATDIDVDAAGIGIGGGLVLRIEQRLEGRIGAAGLEAGRHADAGEKPLPAQAVAFREELPIIRAGDDLVDDGVVVAAVIGGAARNAIGKLIRADQVAPPHLQPIEPAMLCDLLDRALDGVIGRRLSESAHCLLRGFVRGDRNRLILHAVDPVGADNGADRLAELERGAARIGADIVERAHLHRADEARIVERDLDVEIALGAVRIHQHGLLDAALDAIAAADIHVIVYAHRGARQLERKRNLLGKARHLDRRVNIKNLAPRVPAREHGEGFDRHCRAAAPFEAQRQAMRALGKILLDLTPDEGAVEQHVGAVIRVYDRTAGPVSRFAVEHERQWLIIHAHQLGGVFGERAGVCDHGGHPFPGVARDLDGERAPRHLRGVEAGKQRLRRRRQLAAVKHAVHAGHRERLGFIDCDDARRGMRTGHQRNVPHGRYRNIGGEAASADDEAAILAHAAIARHEAEGLHGSRSGRFKPRMRSAASAIASTICA